MKRALIAGVLLLAGCSHKPSLIGLSCIGTHTKNVNGQETKDQTTTHYIVDLKGNNVFRLDDDGVHKPVCGDGMTCKVRIDNDTVDVTVDGPFSLAGPSGSAHGRLHIDRVSGHFVMVSTILDGQPNDSLVETKVGMCEPEPVSPEPTQRKF